MLNPNIKVAVAQMCSGPSINLNLAQADLLCQHAADAEAKLIVLPENFAIFGAPDLQTIDTSPILHFLEASAKKYDLWIVAGSLPYPQNRHGQAAPPLKVFTSCGLWSPQGKCLTRYDKCHLFDVDVADQQGRYRESDHFAAGDAPVIYTTPFGILGFSICYDLRFPEYYRQLSQQGAHILVAPSAFTYVTGEAHWEVLIRARAIENQAYVLAANQGGQHPNGRQTWGHSSIIDPWGRILDQCAEPGPGLAIAELCWEEHQTLQSRMPVLTHRRF